MHTTSPTLLESLKQGGDDEAWSRFVDLYAPLVFHWVRRMGLQEADAADLVQEIFAVLVRTMPDFTYDANRSFRAWLRTVVLNQWRDRRRRSAARPVESTGATLPEPIDADAIEAFSDAEYRAELVARAMELMQASFQPTTWKACWELVVNNRPAAEVAAELGITENAVYLAKGRVLRVLRKELQGFLE